MPSHAFDRIVMSAKIELERQREVAEIAVRQAKYFENALHILTRLSKGWYTDSPGKYGVYAFFVRSYSLAEGCVSDSLSRICGCEGFIAEEIVDDLEEAKKGIAPGCGGGERIPVPLGKLADATTRLCLECGITAYVIGAFYQAFDSPDGDAWEMDLYTLCFECGAVKLFATKMLEYPFLKMVASEK